MSKTHFDIPVIKNKKLFEKQLQKVKGFTELKHSNGVDSRSILYIPETQTIAVAGLHEDEGKPQFLSLYNLDIQITNFLKNDRIHKRRSTMVDSNREVRKRNSEQIPFSRTSLLESLIKTRGDKIGENVKKEALRTGSGQSVNVGKKETSVEVIIQQSEEESPEPKGSKTVLFRYDTVTNHQKQNRTFRAKTVI